ncbi:hypothetical protein FOCC_FOCC012914 [Frankliniella occidentalis]|nr:hypothetical protein FOCC_FOCC012914 [Frankliniella occidentalis]
MDGDPMETNGKSAFHTSAVDMPPSQQITPPVLEKNAANLASPAQSDLVNFYKGQNILITGATGFMGKVLLEKLLYTCHEVGTIYMLIRTKKGQQPEQRLDTIFDSPMFERLREERPKFRHHLHAVSGDVGEPGLGLSAEDRVTLADKVNIVFHCAATVRFDEVLNVAVNINVRGTKCVVDLCKEMKDLRVFMHVSTAYANCPKQHIGEEIYDMPLDCERVMRLSDATGGDPKLIEALTPAGQLRERALARLDRQPVRPRRRGARLGRRPDARAQRGRQEAGGPGARRHGLQRPPRLRLGDGLPHVSVGPSVFRAVRCAARGPRCVMSSPSRTFRPEERAAEVDGVPIYNYISSTDNPLTWDLFMQHTSYYGDRMPVNQAVWIYCLSLVPGRWAYLFLIGLLHFLPALLVDIVCVAIGNKFRAIPVYKKIYKFSEVIAYFGLREWYFKNHHTKNLWRRLSPKDQELFAFDITQIDWFKYLGDYTKGMRIFMFKENPTTIPQGLARRRRFWYLHQAVRAASAYLVLRACWAVLVWLVVGRPELVAAVQAS